ncbi:MAG: hypothetical protein SGI74_07375 [Oligoflexia bacterium]|nr:hypothetical protein [Oligoflexia bacterium]
MNPESFVQGFLGFFKVTSLLLIILEISLLIEEFFKNRIEFRKGFTGTKSSIAKTLQRHALKVLRMEGDLKAHFGTALGCTFIFLTAGLLPVWSNEIVLHAPHSLWVFLGMSMIGPTLALIFQWTQKSGSGWPFVLSHAERSIGSATVLFILGIALVAMTGSDSFSEIQKSQEAGGGLVFQYPLSIILMFALVVINLFLSFQTMFSKSDTEVKHHGWTLDDLIPHLRRTIWSLFIVDTFLGGAHGVMGNGLLILKCVILNVSSEVLSCLFVRLREDQAESFILWKLTPISILILTLSLFLPSGCT